MDNWYDYPQYWELAFAEDTQPEADFIEAACQQFATIPVRRLLEPGCGSGRLVMELTRRGYQLTGFDLNQPSLDYLRRRLRRRGWQAEVFCGDMSCFQLRRPVDAAFNTFSTFRHLLTEEAAVGHLQSIAAALRPGGIYILGFHLVPPDASLESTERWRAARGQTRVVYTFRVTSADRRRRREHVRVNLLVKRPQGELRLITEFDLRLYTAAQFRGLLAQVPQLQLCGVFDYTYDLETPLKLDNEISDTIVILRKQG
ncbi:MAG: class I SAM-dependent methyltransferase [Pirellulales bacterium]